MNLKAQLLSALLGQLLPVVIQFGLDNLEEFRKFLQEQAKKTDNKIDDYMVDVICDWAKGFLEAAK